MGVSPMVSVLRHIFVVCNHALIRVIREIRGYSSSRLNRNPVSCLQLVSVSSVLSVFNNPYYSY